MAALRPAGSSSVAVAGERFADAACCGDTRMDPGHWLPHLANKFLPDLIEHSFQIEAVIETRDLAVAHGQHYDS